MLIRMLHSYTGTRIVLSFLLGVLLWSLADADTQHAANAGSLEQARQFGLAVSGADQNYVPSDPSSRPPAGHKWIMVSASLQNLSGPPVVVHAETLALVDQTGKRHFPSSSSPHAKPSLVGAVLAPGEWIRGLALYEVPDGVTGVDLEWCPGGPIACAVPLRSRIPQAPGDRPSATPTSTAVATATSTSTSTVTPSASPTGTATATSTATVTAAPTSTSTSTPVPAGTEVRVNAGGEAYTDTTDHAWAGDSGFSGGLTYLTVASIAGTTDGKLYQTERYGDYFSFSVPVATGPYQVTLKFAEIYWTETSFERLAMPGQRVFHVTLEEQLVLHNFDILAEVTPNTALDKTFQVNVGDGALDLVFIGIANNAKVSAIQIVPGIVS